MNSERVVHTEYKQCSTTERTGKMVTCQRLLIGICSPNISLRMVGLSCSITRESLESIVLSTTIFPDWQASTTPPRQEVFAPAVGAAGKGFSLSIVNLTAFFEPDTL